MSKFDDFVKRMKEEKDGFAEVWESKRIIRELAIVKECKKISQKELSERTGLKQSQISRFFACNTTPRIDLVVKIAMALDCKISLEVDER